MNISSIVVQTLKENLAQVVEDLKNCEACDYHMHDDLGRVIVTIEGENVEEELKKLRLIEAIPNVMSADMQMAYSEEELNSHIDVLENSSAVPKILNENDVDVRDIVYKGDLKRKDLESFARTFDDNSQN